MTRAGGPPAWGGPPAGSGLRRGSSSDVDAKRRFGRKASFRTWRPRVRLSSSAFVLACGGGSRGELLRLVLYLRGDLLELRLELAAMVGAEQQLSAAHEDNAQIRLSVAPVAAVGCRQRSRGGQNCSHVASSLARRAVVPGSTSNQAENVPALAFIPELFSPGGRIVAGWRRMGRIAGVGGFPSVVRRCVRSVVRSVTVGGGRFCQWRRQVCFVALCRPPTPSRSTRRCGGRARSLNGSCLDGNVMCTAPGLLSNRISNVG